MSDLINLFIHHWALSIPRAHPGQCHGSGSRPWLALACAPSVRLLRKDGCAAPATAVLVSKVAWAPHHENQTPTTLWSTPHTYSSDTHKLALRSDFLLYLQLGRLRQKCNPWSQSLFLKVTWVGEGDLIVDPSAFDPSPLWPAFSHLPSLMPLHRIFPLTFTGEQRKHKAHSLCFSVWSCLPWPDFLKDPYLCILALTTLITAGSSVSIIRKY